VTFVLDARSAVDGPALEAAAEALARRAPAAESIAASFRKAGSAQVLGRDLRVLRGPATLSDSLGDDAGSYAHAMHGSFVQVHRDPARRIRALVADALAAELGGLQGRTVVDAHAGSGATGITLARRGAAVILLESHAPSVESARSAAVAQGLGRVEIAPGDAGEGLEALARAGRAVDAIVLNPPRRGVSARARVATALSTSQVVAYVSCDPDTLARDLDVLARLGWRADVLVPFDMMPQTEEVETVAVLRRAPPSAPMVLHDAGDLVAVDKPSGEPMVPGPDARATLPALVTRVRGLPGLGEAVALAPLDAGTSGVALFARTPAAAARLGPALAAATAEYEALCRGVTPATRALAPGTLRTLRRVGPHGLVALTGPATGTRGLRRALARIGHPVLGDEKDGHAPSNRHQLERHGLDRPFLHRTRVTIGGLAIHAALPGELQMVLDRLEDGS
jgi:23S rRNA (uracil1939-C5)-methyltransferase